MSDKKVSVIIPCYNVSDFIGKCTASLVGQTIGIENLECIFVDDASTDNTIEKLISYEQQFPDSIIVVSCPENRKQGAAKNIGMSYSTGKYIAFLDADDYVDFDMYEKLYQKAEELECDVVGSFMIREERNGNMLYRDVTKMEIEKLETVSTVNERKKLLMHGLASGGNTKLYRRELIFDHQIFFPEGIQYEDNYWGAMLLNYINSYYIMDACFYHYVVNDESTIMRQNSMHHLDRLAIELMKIEKYKEIGMFEDYHDEIEINFLQLYFINTVYLLFTRFDEVPYEVICDMQRKVRELFPGYLRNPYLKNLDSNQAEILKIVDVELVFDKK